MSGRKTLLDLPNAISSPGSVYGVLRPATRRMARRPARLDRLMSVPAFQRGRQRRAGLMTSGTYGPPCTISSTSVALSRPWRASCEQRRTKWLDLVHADMEGTGYAFGVTLACAAGVGAPHLRERSWWVAHTRGERGAGLLPPLRIGQMRPWGAFGEVDLLSLLERPFSDGRCFPQPIIFSVDDGFTNRVGRLRAYGNAIVLHAAAGFITAAMAALDERHAHMRPAAGRAGDTSAIAMGHRTGSMRIAMFEMEDVPDIMRDAYNEAKDNRRQAIEPPTLKLEAPIER